MSPDGFPDEFITDGFPDKTLMVRSGQTRELWEWWELRQSQRDRQIIDRLDEIIRLLRTREA